MAESPNQDNRPDGQVIDTLVFHYTGMLGARAAYDRLMDPAAKVSAHWLVDEDGTVIPLVPEARRAWHAGVSRWRGQTNINARSIGVEIVNPGHEFGYRPFPKAQMSAVADVCQGILARWPIPRFGVVAHSDIAPTRKEDPGELFDWPWLAQRGIGFWPEGPMPGRDADPVALLRAIGYDVAAETPAVRAFQRRYRPSDFSGVVDEETLGLMRAVRAADEVDRAQAVRHSLLGIP